MDNKLSIQTLLYRSSTCTFLTLTRVSVSSSNLRPIILAIASLASADMYGCCFRSKLYGRGSSCSRSILAAFSAPELVSSRQGCKSNQHKVEILKTSCRQCNSLATARSVSLATPKKKAPNVPFPEDQVPCELIVPRHRSLLEHQ